MKQPPQQICICWTLDWKSPQQEKNRLIAEGNEVIETVVPGYCPCCGYNFNLTILNVNTIEPWQSAKMSCPKCNSEGFAVQYRIAHRKKKIQCYGCLGITFLLIFVITNIIRTCS